MGSLRGIKSQDKFEEWAQYEEFCKRKDAIPERQFRVMFSMYKHKYMIWRDSYKTETWMLVNVDVDANPFARRDPVPYLTVRALIKKGFLQQTNNPMTEEYRLSETGHDFFNEYFFWLGRASQGLRNPHELIERK